MNTVANVAPIVALVGNPNCGKTALFNALTGSRQKVANYPGVTVEKKVGRLTTPAGRVIRVVDLPGTYSLRARSPDEEITRDVVLGKLAGEIVPDLIVCVADASNLRLALRLALELKQVGRPVMLSLNMMDIARRRGIEIDTDRLARELGVPIVQSVAVRRGGTDALLGEIDRRLDERPATAASDWRPPDAGQLRVGQREADRLLAAAVRSSGQRDTLTGARRCRAAAPGGRPDRAAGAPVRDVPGGVRLGASRRWMRSRRASTGSARWSGRRRCPICSRASSRTG